MYCRQPAIRPPRPEAAGWRGRDWGGEPHCAGQAAAGRARRLHDWLLGFDPHGIPVLTASGHEAYTRIFAARQDLIERLLEGSHPQLHRRLLELVTEITHELAASSERPEPDLDPVR
jgi:hypothetical protein